MHLNRVNEKKSELRAQTETIRRAPASKILLGRKIFTLVKIKKR